jgi:hypothetical protein
LYRRPELSKVYPVPESRTFYEAGSRAAPQSILTDTMEELRYEHFSPRIQNVRLAFFENVRNAGTLRKQIIAASTAVGEVGDAERVAVNFAFIDPRPVRINTSVLRIWAAAEQCLFVDSGSAASINSDTSSNASRNARCIADKNRAF